MTQEYPNVEQLSTKALPQYNWGQEWVKPNGDLACIVVIYEDLDEPIFLHKALPGKDLADGILPFSNATSSMSEKTFYKHYPAVIKDWINKHPGSLVLMTACHAFALDLISNADFRPDMFYLYDKDRGYRRLPDTTAIALRRTKNYRKMYVADAFDGGVGSFEVENKTE